MNRLIWLDVVLLSLVIACVLINAARVRPTRRRNRVSSRDAQDETASQTFKQCIDHSTSNGCNTFWNQRYWVRTDYYQANGPIFFEFGAEGSANGQIDDDYFTNYASQYNALLLVLEHRFYGESFPNSGTSAKDLKTLSSQQALADAAYFLRQYIINNPTYQGAKIVVFGGSYGGSLAAWMKQKYPDLIKAAVASSAPLQYTYNLTGFLETYSNVVWDLDPKCYRRIYKAFNCMESLVDGYSCTGYNDASDIPCALNQCCDYNFDDQFSREDFFSTLVLSSDGWSSNWPSSQITKNCKILNRVSGAGPIEIYGNYLAKQNSVRFCPRSADIQSTQSRARPSSVSRRHDKKSDDFDYWDWQTCNEFGDYFSSDPVNGLFGYNTFSGTPYASTTCPDEFGSKYTTDYIVSRIEATNSYYKGRGYDGKCVVFVNGAWDPWHSLGIYDPSQTSSKNTVVFVPKGEHCDDMSDGDTDDMKIAQQKIQDQIGVYLNNPNC